MQILITDSWSQDTIKLLFSQSRKPVIELASSAIMFSASYIHSRKMLLHSKNVIEWPAMQYYFLHHIIKQLLTVGLVIMEFYGFLQQY